MRGNVGFMGFNWSHDEDSSAGILNTSRLAENSFLLWFELRTWLQKITSTRQVVGSLPRSFLVANVATLETLKT